MDVLPYGRHLIEEDDIRAVVEVLRHGWLTQGPKVAEFEEAVAARCGARHAVACSSGTAALHIAAVAAGLRPGDELVSPAITFLATGNCAVFVGATPRFSDIDFATARMTPETLEPVLTERTRAVVPVHFAGLPCDMPALAALVRERCPRAVLIEDACHAFGGTHEDGTPVGSLKWADMVMFSFHPVKHVAAGEGGMILTDRDDLADRLRLLRSHGMTKDPERLTRPDEGPWYYEMQTLGFNYRLPDVNCALALSQLRKLDRFVARRREIAAHYHDALADLPHTLLPLPETVERSAWHVYGVKIDFESRGTTRSELVGRLLVRGIGTQVHYYPVPLQPWYRELFGASEGDFPAAELHYAQELTIPLFPAMTNEDVDRVVDALHAELR